MRTAIKNANHLFIFRGIIISILISASLLGKSQNTKTPVFIITYQYSVDIKEGNINFPFTMTYRVIGNKDSSTSYFIEADKGESQNISIDINLPDRVVFDGKHWNSIKNGTRTREPFQEQNVVSTNEKKNILGYECQKFISKFPDSSTAEIWVCKSLPGTLMPAGGGKPLGGAILEWRMAEKNILFKATSIQKNIDMSSFYKSPGQLD